MHLEPFLHSVCVCVWVVGQKWKVKDSTMFPEQAVKVRAWETLWKIHSIERNSVAESVDGVAEFHTLAIIDSCSFWRKQTTKVQDFPC